MNNETMKRCQTVVMSLLAVIYVVMIIRQLFTGLSTFDSCLSLVMQLIELLALISSAFYLGKEYGKEGAAYYNVFLVLFLILSVLTIIKPVTHGETLVIIPHAASVAILAILTFKKDLGEKNSWILYWILMVLQILIAMRAFFSGNVSRILDMASHLLLIGTYGFMLKGKYEDKKQRGSER